jgi:hypothetical protein
MEKEGTNLQHEFFATEEYPLPIDLLQGTVALRV